jgi:long-chain acyl-CoA synthetase
MSHVLSRPLFRRNRVPTRLVCTDRWIARNALERPDFVVMSQGEESWTYERLINDVRRLARGLAILGVKPGDRVVLHLGNYAVAAIACYATFMIEGIVFTMNCRYVLGEVKRLIERLPPALYLGHGDVYGGLSHVDTALPLERRFVVDGAAPESGVKSWKHALRCRVAAVAKRPRS